MNQNFSFMKELVPKILDGSKILTNRIASEFRMYCDKGDIMHLFTGMRTKNCQKIGDAIVLERKEWFPTWIPCKDNFNNYTPMFPIRFTWQQFMKADGFEKYNDFAIFFTRKKYEVGIYCYLFEVISLE